MTPGLKLTILASSALAVTLNLIQLTASAASEPKDAFAFNNAPVAASPRPITAKATVVTTPTPTPSAETPATATPAPATPAPTPTPDPSVAGAAAKLIAAGLSSTFARNYLDVQAKTGTPWQLLAAVHKIETNQSGDASISSYAGAAGPMQFMPATFAYYGRDGDGNGTATINDVDDAIMSAGNYLRANGAAAGNYSNALYHYNHSYTYVANVLAIARRLGL